MPCTLEKEPPLPKKPPLETLVWTWVAQHRKVQEDKQDHNPRKEKSPAHTLYINRNAHQRNKISHHIHKKSQLSFIFLLLCDKNRLLMFLLQNCKCDTTLVPNILLDALTEPSPTFCDDQKLGPEHNNKGISCPICLHGPSLVHPLSI